jgi:hypothetical protein
MMDYAAFLVVGIVAGYLLCFFTVRLVRSESKMFSDPKEVVVRRSRLSMRSPLRTVRTEYNRYKTNDTGLYAPVRPKATSADQIEVGR